MGSIVPRKRKDGTVVYSAQIVIKRDNQIVHRESQTFERKQAAVAWVRKREEHLAQPGALDEASKFTLSDAIDKYTEASAKDLGKTKAQVLRSIKQHDLAKMRCSTIKSHDIVSFAQGLLAGGRMPQTVGNYLSHLSAIFAIAQPAWGIELDRAAMNDALPVLKRLGVTSKSEKRDRRPTLDELDALMTFFVERQERAPDSAPMHKIIAYGIFSTRRQDEIVRPLWRHLDEDGSRLLVKDMKHPGQKAGNDVWCDLPPEALAIVRTMPRTAGAIFPYTADAISAAFTRACQVLEIKDLHFHDLRHDGVSRLFEMGWSVPHVATVSGHRSWASLQRYTHIRQRGDKYEGWKWKKLLLP